MLRIQSIHFRAFGRYHLLTKDVRHCVSGRNLREAYISLFSMETMALILMIEQLPVTNRTNVPFLFLQASQAFCNLRFFEGFVSNSGSMNTIEDGGG